MFGSAQGFRGGSCYFLPGTPASITFYRTVAEIDHPERLLPIGWNRTSGGVFSQGPFPGRLFMLDFSGPPEDRQAPVTGDEIEAALCRISGKDVRVKGAACRRCGTCAFALR